MVVLCPHAGCLVHVVNPVRGVALIPCCSGEERREREAAVRERTYVLVITSTKQVGTYFGHDIFQVTSLKFISCNEALKLSSYQEKRDEAYFTTLLKTVELTPGLYYSYEVDLTVNLQRKYRLADKSVFKPLWKQADPRYVWNKSLMEDLIEAKVLHHIIWSLYSMRQNNSMTYLLSSIMLRASSRNKGTRMWRRGANLEGDTANFVETEQIVQFDGLVAAYMQIRGSIPLLWEQIVDLSYKPGLNIINHVETSKVVERHFVDLAQRYGSILVIDLTDKVGLLHKSDM
ncbi:Phosphoinositide phosphatase [Nymphaea thermarum]|nr:Phosphoinositide phosphatase [Nymphaea thermarum]